MGDENMKSVTTVDWDKIWRKFADLEDSVKFAMTEVDKSTRDNKPLRESSQTKQDGLQSKNMSLQEELKEAKRRNDILEQERRKDRRKAEEERRKAEEERRKVEEERRTADEKRCKAEEGRRKAEEERRTAEEQRRKAEGDMKRLTTQLQEARESTTATATEVVKRIEKCEGGLEKLRARVDSLSAPQSLSQMSDSHVASQFTGLLEHIKSWVDEELHEPRSLQKLEACLTSQHPQARLGCLDKHLESKHIQIAKDYVNSHRTLLCAIIYRHLRCSVLEMVPVLAIDDQRANDISQSLCSALSSLLQDGHCKKEAQNQLHKQITVPALQLARCLRLSTATYRIVRGRPLTTSVYEEDMQRCIIIDLATQRSVLPKNVGVVGRYGRIGEQKLMVHSGLQRCHDGYGRDVTLCKPMILVNLDAPLRPRSRLSY